MHKQKWGKELLELPERYNKSSGHTSSRVVPIGLPHDWAYHTSSRVVPIGLHPEEASRRSKGEVSKQPRTPRGSAGATENPQKKMKRTVRDEEDDKEGSCATESTEYLEEMKRRFKQILGHEVLEEDEEVVVEIKEMTDSQLLHRACLIDSELLHRMMDHCLIDSSLRSWLKKKDSLLRAELQVVRDKLQVVSDELHVLEQ